MAVSPVVGSTRGPVHIAAAENVHVDMKNGLSGLFAVIKNNPIVVDALFLRNLGAFAHDFTDELLIFRRKACRSADMLFGDDEKVDRRLGRNIPEGQNVIVFVYDIGRDVSTGDFAEQAVVGHNSLLG